MGLVPDLTQIKAMDAEDTLAPLRDEFILPADMIYLDGNSLGAATHAALKELQKAATHEWSQDLIKSWNKAGWFDMPITLGDRIGKLIGAASGQTVVCDTTSTNIYKLLHTALSMRPDRSVIVAEGASFPTDLYVAQGVISVMPGTNLRLEGVDAPDIESLIDESVAVVLVNHVNYQSGTLRDMAALTQKAHAAGALIIWDLCHSAGALPVELDQSAADFAVGCTYKYLNGGPGAPAFIYAAQHLHDNIRQPLSGWWGHARPFAFEQNYQAGSGMKQFLCGTQPVLSLRALKGSLDTWDKVDLSAVRTKSIALTDLFVQLVEDKCARYGLELISERDGSKRGSQISFSHPHSYEIMQALIDRGVVGDFRAPSSMRFGFTPLYTSYLDVWQAVEILVKILADGTWQASKYAIRTAVT